MIQVLGNGSQISIAGLGFSAISTDPGNTLGFGFGTGSYNYSLDYRGLQYGLDGIRGTADDVWITSGSADQLVDEIIGRGSGNGYAVYDSDPGGTRQEKIDLAAAALYQGSYDFIGTYTYADVSGSGTIHFNERGANVPDSGMTALLLGIGCFGLVGIKRFSGATHTV